MRYILPRKERKKQSRERYENLSIQEKEEIDNNGVNNAKSSLKMKNKGWLNTEKNIINWVKTLHND